MAIDVFVNNGSATVSSGGTTALAAGTVETWDMSSVVGLAASSGVTQMRLIDPAAASEIMLLTNYDSGTGQATVTRAVEGTSVAHAAGFTVQAVVTAGALAAAMQALQTATFGATPIAPLSGHVYMAGNATGGPGTHGNAGGAVRLEPIFLTESATATSLGVYVSSAAAAGTTIHLGIYESDGQHHLPKTLLLDAGAVLVDSTGFKSIAISQPLDPGLYWVAYTGEGSWGGYSSNPNLGAQFGYVGTPSGAAAPQGIYRGNVGTVLESSIDPANLVYTATLYASSYIGF